MSKAADLPPSLAPIAGDFFCTDKEGSDNIAAMYRDEKDCKDNLNACVKLASKNSSDLPWTLVKIGAGIIVGAVIEHQLK
jgi:hypothetical protein